MSITIEAFIQIIGGAENIFPQDNSAIKLLVDNANKAYKEIVLKRFGKLVGQNIADACGNFSSNWEFSKNNNFDELINFTEEDVSRFLSRGFHSVAELNNKTSVAIEIRTPTEIVAGNKYGIQLESKSSFYSIDPALVWPVIEAGATLTARHIDLFATPFAFISDELVALTGTSTFAKLFATGGIKTTSGRHFDSSDVLIIVLKGKKHFRIEAPEGINEKGFDKVLNAGDSLIIPTPWPHLVTPLGTTCIHVTFGIKQNQHWIQSEVIPSHLGYSDRFVDNLNVIRGLIPPKLPPSFTKLIGEKSIIRTAIPGGVVLVNADETKALFKILAAGKIVSMNKLELNVLLNTHSQGCGSVGDICKNTGTSIKETIDILAKLQETRLLGINEHPFYV